MFSSSFHRVFSVFIYLHCALSLAAQCIVVGHVCGGRAACVCLCVCVCVCVCVCGSVTTITRNCVHRSSPNWVCSLLNFGRPTPPVRGLRRCEIWDPLITFERKELSTSNLVQTKGRSLPAYGPKRPLSGRGRGHVT